MRRGRLSACAAALVLALVVGAVQAKGTQGLTANNFVDVGDSVTDMLNTSGLAFSTLLLGSNAALDARSARTRFQPPPMPASEEQSSESDCPGGGSVKATVSDTDGSADLSTGDRVITVFRACVIDGSAVTGRSEFVVAAHRVEAGTETTELEFRFSDLGTADFRWSGPARVLLRSDLRRGTEHYIVTYRDLAVTRNSRSMRWDFRLDLLRPPIGNQVVSVEGSMTLAGLQLRLHQDDPYVITSDGFPRAGQLTASDKRGARLQVEAGRRRYAYRFYRAGNHGELPDLSSRSNPYGKP
jgi:hypothetical protein